MFIFQVFIRAADGQLLQGLLLAESRPRAVELAVQRTKEQYGSGARVKLIVPVIDAGDVSRIQHSGLHTLLAELDQLRFITWHLHTHTRRMAERVHRLIELVKEKQELERRREQ